MKLKFPSVLLGCSFAVLTSANAATFVVGDGFALDGSGSFAPTPDTNSQSTPGSIGRDAAIDSAEISSVYNVTTSSFVTDNPFSSNPFIVGQINFRNDVFRSSLTYDLSGLPLGGSNLMVTDVTLFLEVAGSTFNNGIAPGEIVTVNVYANAAIDALALPAVPDATFTLDGNNDIGGTFISVVIPTSAFDVTQSTFTLVLDAGSTPTTAGVFGTSLGTGPGVETGTTAINRAPALQITTVPEPSVFSLAALAGLGLLARRRRQS